MRRSPCPTEALVRRPQDDVFHRRLAAFNARRFTPGLPHDGWEADDHAQCADASSRRGAGSSSSASGSPRGPRRRRVTRPGSSPGSRSWTALGPGRATRCSPGWPSRLAWTRCAGSSPRRSRARPGFEDLTAVTQVRLPQRPKLELARNYWDEMGRGNPKGMHGPMLETLARALKLEPRVETTVWESLALANTMAGWPATGATRSIRSARWA